MHSLDKLMTADGITGKHERTDIAIEFNVWARGHWDSWTLETLWTMFYRGMVGNKPCKADQIAEADYVIYPFSS